MRGSFGVEAPDQRGIRELARPLDPEPFAVRRKRATAPASASGSVRRSPIFASSMSSAAACPVINEIWAFQPSTGSGALKASL